MKKKHTTAQVLLFLTLTGAVSCTTAPPLPSDKQHDYITNGFLDDHHYQITASARPDPSAKGLVAQRESALIKARNDLQKKAVDGLIRYRLSLFLAQNHAAYHETDQIISRLHDEMLEYMSYGSVVEEYYDRDNSAEVVFRIEKKNLRDEIGNVNLLVPKEKTLTSTEKGAEQK